VPSQEYRKDQPQTAASPLGPDDAEHTLPGDTTGNSPKDVQESALAVNTTEATEAQKLQADTEINQDPEIPDEDSQPRTATSENVQDYDGMNLEELREELGNRHLSKSGNKPDLIARLRDHDASQGAPTQQGTSGGDVDLAGGSSDNLGAETTDAEASPAAPRGEVDPTNVENGGIQRTQAGQQHAEVLQGLSNERRQQQLDAAKDQQQD
jgi:hypothetical protein